LHYFGYFGIIKWNAYYLPLYIKYDWQSI